MLKQAGRMWIAIIVIAVVSLGRSVPASAMLTTDLHFNLDFADVSSSGLTLSALSVPVMVQVTYFVSKPGAGVIARVDSLPLVSVPEFGTVQVPLALSGKEFAGSEVLVKVLSVDSTGTPSSSQFMAFLQTRADKDLNPVSGDAFEGNIFALLAGADAKPKFRLLITVVTPTVVPADVRVRVFGTSVDEHLQIGANQTVAWDSASHLSPQDLARVSWIEISSSESMVVSAFLERPGHNAVSSHIYLPALSGP